MTSGNLTPKPHTDKNELIKPTESLSAPLPRTVPTVVSGAVLSAASYAITAKLDPREAMTSLYYGVVKDIIGKYSAHTLQALTALVEDDKKAAAVYTGLMKNWAEATVNDYLNLADFFRTHNISNDMHSYIQSLRYYEDMCPQEDDSYPEQRREQAEAIIELIEYLRTVLFEETNSLMEHGVIVPYIRNENLRKLVTISEHRQKIVRLVKQRNIIDADTLAGLIESDAGVSSLTEGIL